MSKIERTPNPPPTDPSYLVIPSIERRDPDRSYPNSGEEYNPPLERRESWFDVPSDTKGDISQPGTEALREEPDASSSQ